MMIMMMMMMMIMMMMMMMIIIIIHRKEDPLIEVVRTHQHNTDSAVLQTARYLKTEVQREVRKNEG